MSIKPVQNQFNGGEISPYMEGRFDLPAYQYSAAILQNFIPISEGCFKRRGGTRFVNEVKQSEGILFKIIPYPAEATVTINGVVMTETYVAYGDLVTYSVSAPEYSTKNGRLIVKENTELEINLPSLVNRHSVSIEATPENATVVINGLERDFASLGENAPLNWSVQAEGYHPQSGYIPELKDDVNLIINLKMRFSIVADLEDAIIIINGVERNFIDVDKNEEVSWSVSKDGYETISGTQIVTESLIRYVTLGSQVAGQVMIDISKAGSSSFYMEDGIYRIEMSGAGSGGSNPIGGAGGGVVFEAEFDVGVYSVDVGRHGAGAGAYVRNNNGQYGTATVLKKDGVALVTCHPGTPGYGRRKGGYLGKVGDIVFNLPEYSIVSRNTAGETSNISFISKTTSGPGAGGLAQSNDEGAGYPGKDGYIKITFKGRK